MKTKSVAVEFFEDFLFLNQNRKRDKDGDTTDPQEGLERQAMIKAMREKEREERKNGGNFPKSKMR